MPFRLKNGPQVFQAIIDKILKPISKFCIVYITNILVFSYKRFMYIIHLHKILHCFKNNIIISKKKIELLKLK